MNIDKAKTHLYLLFAVLFIFVGIPFSYAQDDLDRSYLIHADFNHIDQRTFPIEMVASITNKSKTPVSELQWIFYPNRFLNELPNLNDLNYRRIYPNGFSKGYLKIVSLKLNDEEIADQMQMISVEPLPDHTLYSLQLDQALEPGETKKFFFTLELKVPRKFGSFGYYRDRLTLSGGWTPFVASYRNGKFYPTDQSPKANWNVTIKTTHREIAGSQFIDAETNPNEKTFVKENTGQFPIQIGPSLKKKSYAHNDFQLQVVYDEKKPEKIIQPLVAVFNPLADYVGDLSIDSSLLRKNLTFVQAPLREMLTVDAGDMSFFSDRAYKLIQGLQPFHNVPLIRMTFSQMFFDQISRKENAEDYYWITEVVSSQLTEDFLNTQHYKYRDARNIGVVKFFSIFPLIDLIIHTPQFAFFDVFYDFVYPYDPVRDEFSRFQHRRQYGRSVLAHMIDELGEEKVHEVVMAYVKNSDKTFEQITEEQVGKKLDQRFVHWKSQRPVVNYKIDKIKTKKSTDGYDYQVTIEKQSSKIFEEPVQIMAVEKTGKQQMITWDSEETKHTFELKTQAKLKSVEIDPNRRLLETKLSDNRDPAYWKFVLTEFFAEYDFNAGKPLIFAQSQLRKKYGGQDRYNLGGFYEVDSYGVNVGYVRLFGTILDSLRLSNGLGIQYNFSRLTQDTVDVDAPVPTSVIVTDSGFLTSLTTSYSFGNQVSYTNPLQGGYGGLAFTYGSKAFGGDFNYYSSSLHGAWVFKLHPSHLLAFQGLFGVAGPDSMPSQIQFRLGGITTMRGLGVSDEKYIGRNILMVSGEYRHFLIQDCDVNLGLFRVRDVQGALFGDAGRVTNTVQEDANQAVLGAAATSTTFSDLFEIQHFETDVGYGLRFFVDYLGVSTSIIRFDLARSLSDKSQGYRFYFGVTQSF